MGKWLYKWEIEYYDNGLLIRRVYVRAKDKTNALKKLLETEKHVIEIKSCRRIDTW